MGGLGVAVGALGGFGYWQFSILSLRVVTLESTLSSTTALLVGTIEATQATLSESLTAQKESLENQLGSVSEHLSHVSGTGGTLEKLSKTDPELLAKYSKVFFLNKSYAPERVVTIDSVYLYYETNPETIHVSVWPQLEDLLQRAKRDNIELYVPSGYRSFTEQSALKDAYLVTYGAGTANAFSADQGYSEHQLGTTVDFITTGLGGQLAGFEKTSSFTWLNENVYKYGFVISYPKGNSYYLFEPWHWRYVGVALATFLHNQGLYFYNIDQRTIDGFLVNIFD